MPDLKARRSIWLNIAFEVAKLSKDPKTKVGAVLVSEDELNFSIGWNGFGKGVEETPERWERPEKYNWVVHAEINALLNCPFPTKNCVLYVTHQPCHRCHSALINAGVSQVWYSRKYVSVNDLRYTNALSNKLPLCQAEGEI